MVAAGYERGAMATINSESLKGSGEAAQGAMTPGDAREIVMDQTAGDRKAGKTYTVDSALADHYVNRIKIARYVETRQPANQEAPASTEDRAMTSPPRGGRRKT